MNENGTAMPTEGAEETTDAFLSGFDGTEILQESETPSAEPETGSGAEDTPADSGEGKPDTAGQPADTENATLRLESRIHPTPQRITRNPP